jgi:hypothetical protein
MVTSLLLRLGNDPEDRIAKPAVVNAKEVPRSGDESVQST